MTLEGDHPDGWRGWLLGDLFDFSNGVNADKSAYGSGVAFANVFEIIGNEALTETDIPGRVTLAPPLVRRYLVKHGDLLFNRTSETPEELGLAAVYLGTTPIVFGGFVFRGQPKTNELSVAYSRYALRAGYVRRQIVSRGQGAIRANVGQRDLKTVRVVLPTVEEQDVIATRLATADSVVSTLERLIRKKQDIKQGLMQSLLSARTRLPGFTKDWIPVTAGDVGSFKGGSGFPVRYQGATTGDLPFYKVSDMNNRGNERFMTMANNYISRGQQRAMGAVVMPSRAIVFAKVGAAVFLERKRILRAPSCIDNNMAAFVPHDASHDLSFLYYALVHFPFGSLVATGALPSLNGKQLRSIPLRLPSDVAEQEAIARVLQDADDEISVLERRIEKARAVKQGMMQELLTGRTRLRELEAAA